MAASEERMGKALRDGYREKAFLMTKIDGRTKATAAAQIDESLQRLQTGHVDLMQFHEIIRMEDPDRIFAPGGALEADAGGAKSGQGAVHRFHGAQEPGDSSEDAGHGGCAWLPLRHGADAAESPWMRTMTALRAKVVPEAVKRGMGVLGMKPMGGGVILKSKTVSAVECLQYAMNLPTSVVITGCDSLTVLQQALDTARGFKPLTQPEVAAILAKAAPLAQGGQFELYKSSSHFDGTAQHPQWLG